MDSAGIAALVTAVSGALVSVVAVIRNSKSHSTTLSTNTDHITVLTNQIASLAEQVADLKHENSALQTEVRLLREQLQK